MKVYDTYYSVYAADAGQAFYEKQRMNCARRPKWANTDTFIAWANDKMLNEIWSPDVVVGFSRKHELFDFVIIPSTTTLYQWINRGTMKTKNIDLLKKLSRKITTIRSRHHSNKRILGKSIEEHPKEIETRETFGHWEIDTVVGNKIKSSAVLLTLAKRQTRFEVILKLTGKDAESVDQAIHSLKKRAGDAFDQLFKTVTSDNGPEFSGLHDALHNVADVYFSHPYTS